MKLDKQSATNWRKNTEALILRLNNTVGNDLTGEGYYCLEFRGKNHRPLLKRDGLLVAMGMFDINEKLYAVCKYYHII